MTLSGTKQSPIGSFPYLLLSFLGKFIVKETTLGSVFFGNQLHLYPSFSTFILQNVDNSQEGNSDEHLGDFLPEMYTLFPLLVVTDSDLVDSSFDPQVDQITGELVDSVFQFSSPLFSEVVVSMTICQSVLSL